jgi:ABC-type branched-subunit amino acid transport system permease subunit
VIGRSKVLLLVALVSCAGLSTLADKISPYYYDVIIGIGINIILAASLNLINGYTGQFSLGHAGFMAVGAYSSAWLTLSFGYVFGASNPATTTTYFLAYGRRTHGGARGPRGRSSLAALRATIWPSSPLALMRSSKGSSRTPNPSELSEDLAAWPSIRISFGPSPSPP